MSDERSDKQQDQEQRRQPMRAGALSEAFYADPEERAQYGLPRSDDDPMFVVVELNLFHEEGLSGSYAKFEQLYSGLHMTRPKGTPVKIADTYVRCELTIGETKELVPQGSGKHDRVGSAGVHPAREAGHLPHVARLLGESPDR